MKVSVCFFIFFIFCCFQGKAEKLNITVTILPQKYFVEKIGGNFVTVNVMVDKGSDPHTYEPKPSKMVTLANSDVYMTIGLPLEKIWIEKIKANNKKLEVVKMDRGIEKFTTKSLFVNFKANKLLEDPHTWLSPGRVRIMAENIRDILIRKDLEHRKVYQTNFLKFVQYINKVDSTIANIFLNCKVDEPVFMVYHPSFQYFAESFGLVQLSIESEGKEPSPKKLQFLIDRAKKKKIRTIFIEPQLSKKSAQFIAKSVGAKLVTIDPLSYDWGENLIKFAELIECYE
jgi:zinc transport system substrate-binding protein